MELARKTSSQNPASIRAHCIERISDQTAPISTSGQTQRNATGQLFEVEQAESVFSSGGQVGAGGAVLFGSVRVCRRPDTFWQNLSIRTSRPAALLAK